MRILLRVCIILVALVPAACDTTDPEPVIVDETYAHERAAWSQDGNAVAFSGDINGVFGIYAVDTSGANLRLIHAGDALGLSWAPDGQHLAYSEMNLIYQVSVTQDVPQLLIPQAPSIRPSWSSDGRRIAYVRNGIRLFETLTGFDAEIYPYGTYPSWRPDSRSLVVYSSRIDAGTASTIYNVFLLDADSLDRTDLYELVTLDDCAFFSLSPDGRILVFSRKPSGERSQIRRIDISTRTETGLTTDGGDYPAISPDGEWVVYTRTTPGEGGLWLVRMDGSERRRLTSP